MVIRVKFRISLIKKLSLMLLLLAALPLWAGCGGLSEDAVAEVDGEVITKDDLNSAMESMKLQYSQYGAAFPSPGTPEYQELEQQFVSQLVLNAVMLLEAEKMDITASDEKVEEQLTAIIDQSGGEQQFEELMKQNNTDIDEVRDNIYDYLVYQDLFERVTSEIPEPTDEEALQYYEENKAQFQNAQETRKVRHILVADEATANQVRDRLAAGEDFAALAAELSTDQGSKDAGGSLGVVPSVESGFVPEFEQAMVQLTVGQASAPVQSQFGFHVIQVEAIYPPNTQLTFEQVKEDIKLQLAQTGAKEQFFSNWLNEKKNDYEIVYAEGYAPAAAPTTTQPAATTGDQSQSTPAP